MEYCDLAVNLPSPFISTILDFLYGGDGHDSSSALEGAAVGTESDELSCSMLETGISRWIHLENTDILQPVSTSLGHNTEETFSYHSIPARGRRPITHDLKLTGEIQFECGYCTKVFSQLGNRNRHEKTVHSSTKVLACKFCDQQFTTTVCLKKHEAVHAGEKVFQCKFCDDRFASPYGLFAHVRIHGPVKLNERRSGISGKPGTSHRSEIQTGLTPTQVASAKDLLIKQSQRYIPKEPMSTYSNIHPSLPKRFIVEEEMPTGSEMEHLKCKICNVQFVDPKDLHGHNQILHFQESTKFPNSEERMKSSTAIEEPSEQNFDGHNRIGLLHFQESTKFPNSEERLKSSTAIAKQREQHVDKKTEGSYVCKVCGKQFVFPRHLIAHATIHYGHRQTLVQCAFCDRQLKTSADLVEHSERMHTGLKPFQCSICGKRFSDSHELTSHKRARVSQRPYQCR